MIGASADEVCLLAHRLRESSSEQMMLPDTSPPPVRSHRRTCFWWNETRKRAMIASYPLVQLQSIGTIWTKASRGGASATARNRTPEAVALPALAFPLSEEMFLLHEVVYTERDHFQHPMETLEPRKQTDPFWYDCLQLSILMAKSIFTLWNPRSPS